MFFDWLVIHFPWKKCFQKWCLPKGTRFLKKSFTDSSGGKKKEQNNYKSLSSHTLKVSNQNKSFAMLLGRVSHLKPCPCFRTHLDKGQWAGGDAKCWGWPRSGAEEDEEPAPGRDPWGKAEPGKSALIVQGACDNISWWNCLQRSSACASLVSAAVKLCLFEFSCRTSLPKVLQQQNTVQFRHLYSVALLKQVPIRKSAYSCPRYNMW